MLVVGEVSGGSFRRLPLGAPYSKVDRRNALGGLLLRNGQPRYFQGQIWAASQVPSPSRTSLPAVHCLPLVLEDQSLKQFPARLFCVLRETSRTTFVEYTERHQGPINPRALVPRVLSADA
jgi:hypothetical protein